MKQVRGCLMQIFFIIISIMGLKLLHRIGVTNPVVMTIVGFFIGWAVLALFNKWSD